MTPDQPQEFLTALWHHAQSADAATTLQTAADWARSKGCTVHVLGLPSGTASDVAALQAAGARAIAASLPLGGASMLLLCAGPLDQPESFAENVTAGLQGYERICALIAPLGGSAPPSLITPDGQTGGTPLTSPLFWAILIAAPSTPNSYWRPKG